MIGQSKRRSLPTDNAVAAPSRIHGIGVFARAEFSSGERIAYFRGYEIDRDTPYSLVLDGKRIEPTGELRYLNHSCSPNARFSSRWLVASDDISAGEEITVDYLATENMIYHHFVCKCGAHNCRGRI